MYGDDGGMLDDDVMFDNDDMLDDNGDDEMLKDSLFDAVKVIPWPSFLRLQTEMKDKGKFFCEGSKGEVTWVELCSDGDEDGGEKDEEKSVRLWSTISLSCFSRSSFSLSLSFRD